MIDNCPNCDALVDGITGEPYADWLFSAEMVLTDPVSLTIQHTDTELADCWIEYDPEALNSHWAMGVVEP